MKKILLFLMCFMFPFEVLAYSKYIIPGGNTLGIEINSDGIMVIGFYEINGKLNKSNLKVGDYIKKVNDKDVSSILELTNEIENNDKDSITITYKRDDKLLTTKLNLIYENNIYKTGIYVKDKITGIGTLSYIDPETHIYGALGHEIVESSHNKIVEIKTGNIFKNTITSITKSMSGHPGSKNAKFYKNMTYGTITKNTNKGIYGIYNDQFPSTKALPVASNDEIVVGKASILTVLENEEIKSYDIEITSINETAKTKNISFIITDNELLKKTGGVVQGMSGSPIIQNDKIIGAVTHVVVDEPKSGYGIFITSMLKEGESD